MRLIVITRPDFFEGEAQAVGALFRAGLEFLHLRKPGATAAQVEGLLRQIPAAYRTRIALHDHFGLAAPLGVGGIHLNARNPEAPPGWTGRVSCSCHSTEEVRRRKDGCDYVFLSPVYDSISKTGYTAAFTADDLRRARQAGIIDRRVIALGGIGATRLPEVERLGFGGAAVLGDVWNRLHTADFIPHFRQLKQAAAQQRPPVILSIAGSDPSGGAGIQADIKTISALGGYAASVVTAVTVQNTRGVQAVHAVSAQAVAGQMAAVLEDLRVDAVKIGMLPDADVVDAVADCLARYPHGPVVCDPVMKSTSGRDLMDAEAVRTARLRLFPRCALVTPNLPEAGLLCGSSVDSPQAQEEAARTLAETFGTAFLVKGGHLPGGEACDVLCQAGRITRFGGRKVESRNLHGTGCTLSSAIATCLGRGMTVEAATGRAKAYVTQAIRAGSTLGIGHGNGPLWHFFRPAADESEL